MIDGEHREHFVNRFTLQQGVAAGDELIRHMSLAIAGFCAPLSRQCFQTREGRARIDAAGLGRAREAYGCARQQQE